MIQDSVASGEVPFPEAFIINLAERVRRWSSIQKRCADCGLQATRVAGERSFPGWIGCGLAHQRIIAMARKRALPWVLILEDDASFDRQGIERFRALLPYLWNNRDKWERFSGGPTLRSTTEISILDMQHRLMYAQGFCSHFDLIQNSGYDPILKWTPAVGRALDAYHHDLAKDPAVKFRSICTYPHIATQEPSLSDILGKESDYSPHFRFSSKRLRDCLDKAAQGSP